ncbi:hypothetical protein HDU93_009158 [Gonapodya sp. JEL0774]|nr:hypothetical protein HDU93_009158 [Gonapodya sp. JEL0774]
MRSSPPPVLVVPTFRFQSTSITDRAKEAAESVRQTAQETAGSVQKKTQETAASVHKMAEETAASVREKAQDAAAAVHQKAQETVLVAASRPIDQLVVVDHASIRELYDRYQKEADEMAKQAILNECELVTVLDRSSAPQGSHSRSFTVGSYRSLPPVIREVALHSAAEEMILYPKLESMTATDSTTNVAKLRKGHQSVKEGLWRVDEMLTTQGKGSRSVAVEQTVATVVEDLEAHMKTEEESDLVRVRREIDHGTRLRLGAEFSFAKTHVPTRPHPSAPDTGGLKEMMAGLPAAMLDRIKDMGKDFAERRVK